MTALFDSKDSASGGYPFPFWVEFVGKLRGKQVFSLSDNVDVTICDFFKLRPHATH